MTMRWTIGRALRATTALGALAACLSSASVAKAQQGAQSSSDWPCRQIEVADVPASSIWTGPPIDGEAAAWRDDPALADLAQRVSARRTPIEDAVRLIADLAKASENRQRRLTALFAGVYDRLESERREVLSGLERYGRKQKELAEKLRAETRSLREEQDKNPANEQKVKELSEALQWDLRVFEERRRALGYACETPALIEQRLGALARAISAAME